MILVTGINRCISEELIRCLVADGQKIKIFHSKAINLNHYNHWKQKVAFFEGDLLDVTDVYDAIEGVTAVYHCDLIPEWENLGYESRIKYNVEGTANIVNAMLYHGVNRLIFFSSLSALGALPEKIADEQTKIEKNEWTTEYALSIILAEREVWRGSVEGLKINVLNCGQVLTHHCNDYNHFYKESLNIIKNQSVDIYSSSIYYVDVEDVANVAIKVLYEKEWDKRYLVFGGEINRLDFYNQIAQFHSLSIKTKNINATKIFFKLTKDILKSIFLLQRRTFRRVDAKQIMQKFHYDNTWTTEHLNMKWTNLTEFLEKEKYFEKNNDLHGNEIKSEI
ncbi:MAG: NAD-dependent epimerase/dehydratase family protein [Chitinophagales bacterium]|nr:NAD-dependent epimerase/dehydratase family protein [Chitinophagales bacterium]